MNAPIRPEVFAELSRVQLTEALSALATTAAFLADAAEHIRDKSPALAAHWQAQVERARAIAWRQT